MDSNLIRVQHRTTGVDATDWLNTWWRVCRVRHSTQVAARGYASGEAARARLALCEIVDMAEQRAQGWAD